MLEVIVAHPRETNRQIINVGNPANESTIANFAKLMADTYVKHFDPAARPVIQSVASTEFYGKGYEDCDRRMPDTSKLTAIGWKPKVGLEDTVMKSMQYFVQNKTRLVEMLGD